MNLCCVKKYTICVKLYTICVKLYTICVKLYTSCVIFYTAVGRFICFTVLCKVLNSGLTVYVYSRLKIQAQTRLDLFVKIYLLILSSYLRATVQRALPDTIYPMYLCHTYHSYICKHTQYCTNEYSQITQYYYYDKSHYRWAFTTSLIIATFESKMQQRVKSL